MRDAYLAATARALVAAAPHVFWDDTFALKGGTAINVFVRDMPRLSVDLDLVFVAGGDGPVDRVIVFGAPLTDVGDASAAPANGMPPRAVN